MGIDLERFPEVNQELICSICAGVLENPMELPCRHVFCTKHSCPICRKKVRFRNLKPALPLLKNIISKLKIRCDFVQQGCTETVELEQLGAHTSLCPFAPMTCENEGCELTFPRRSKADHEAECPQRVIFCSSTCSQGCGSQLRLAELPGHNCVKSLKSRVEELERTVSDYSQRMSTLEETVNELRRQRDTDQLYSEYSQRSGLADALRHSEANRQQDVDSGLISLLSENEENEENESHSSSPTVGFGGMTPTHTVSLTTVELADTLMTGQREFRRQRSLRRSPPRRERSRSRSPLRQNESQDGTSRRDRESSPSESTCRRRTTRRPRRPMPITPSSPSTSSTSTSTCGIGDSSVVHSRERRHSRPPVIDDSSSEDTPGITGEIWHNVTGTEDLQFDRIPERAVFSTPPGSTEVSAYFGDRWVHEWLQEAVGESPSSDNNNSSGGSSSSTISSSSPSTSC